MLHFTNSIYWSTIRRLSVKVGSRPVVHALGEELRPGPVEGLNQWGDARRQACGQTLRQGLLPQKGPSEDIFNSLRRDSYFCLGRVLEHLASIVFCGRLNPLKPDHSLSRRSLSQRQALSREAQLEPPSLLYWLMN